ncbi:MAG TPA: tetratricopeptide repeat protein [Acetobacteraceae bacterium]|nr:tetratricopeptide repeat protein [Acetobacteraceae bacterium]
MRRNATWLRVHWLPPGIVAVITLAVLVLAGGAWRMGWPALWATADQRGAWLLRHGQFDRASAAFSDPAWRGVALMRAGRFKEAAQSFANASGPDAAYNRGNALVMLGQYAEAIAQYDQALAQRPGWADATANRAIAEVRAARVAHQPGQEADPEEKQRDEVYRRDRDRNEQAANPDAPRPDVMSDEAIRALWLRRVQTKPADFLRARFAYQLQQAAKPDSKP